MAQHNKTNRRIVAFLVGLAMATQIVTAGFASDLPAAGKVSAQGGTVIGESSENTKNGENAEGTGNTAADTDKSVALGGSGADGDAISTAKPELLVQAPSSNLRLGMSMIKTEAELRGALSKTDPEINIVLGSASIQLESVLSITGSGQIIHISSGTGEGAVLVLAPGNTARHFEVSGGAVTLSFGDNVSLVGHGGDALGGGIEIKGGGNLTLRNAKIQNCVQKQGGAIFVGAGLTFSMQGGMLTDNKAIKAGSYSDGYGGGIYANDNSVVTLTGTAGTPVCISDNHAADEGGGIYGSKSRITISYGEIRGNTVGSRSEFTAAAGGGIACTGPGVSGREGSLTITDSSIKENTASASFGLGQGGGIHASYNLALTAVRSTISDNVTNGYGGGISCTAMTQTRGGIKTVQTPTITVTDTQIERNSAGTLGGGISYEIYPRITVNGTSVIRGNTSPYGGGIGCQNGSGGNLTLYITVEEDAIISDNGMGNANGQFKAVQGGGIYCLSDQSDPVTVTIAGTVSGNRASFDGGGIYANQYTPISVQGGAVTGNTAGDSGGGIYVGDLNCLTVDGTSTFGGNKAGAAYTLQDAHRVLYDQKIQISDWSRGVDDLMFPFGYNNYDISYKNGDPLLFYRVTFDSRGGSEVPVRWVKSGDPVQQPAAPLRSGWNFGGWYEEPACSTLWNFSNPITGNRTLYAHWASPPDYALTAPDTVRRPVNDRFPPKDNNPFDEQSFIQEVLQPSVLSNGAAFPGSVRYSLTGFDAVLFSATSSEPIPTTLHATFTNSSGQPQTLSQPVLVVVEDTVAPIITVGAADVTLPKGDAVTDNSQLLALGKAACLDNYDGALTPSHEIRSSADSVVDLNSISWSSAGTYTVLLTAADSSRNPAAAQSFRFTVQAPDSGSSSEDSSSGGGSSGGGSSGGGSSGSGSSGGGSSGGTTTPDKPIPPPAVTPEIPGPGAGNTGSGSSSSANRPDSTYTPIGDMPLPLENLPFAEIFEDEVPLAALPQTGGRSLPALGLLGALLPAAWLLRRKKPR